MPPTTTDTFLVLQSPQRKAHLRHGKIRVMKYVAHWQRHQSDDSRRTHNKGKERWSSSIEKENGKKRKAENQPRDETIM